MNDEYDTQDPSPITIAKINKENYMGEVTLVDLITCPEAESNAANIIRGNEEPNEFDKLINEGTTTKIPKTLHSSLTKICLLM